MDDLQELNKGIGKALIKHTDSTIPRYEVPIYIIQYLEELGYNVDNTNQFYMELLQRMPEGAIKPTYDEAINYYGIARMQRIADSQLQCIEFNKKELKKRNLSEEEKIDIQRTIKKSENQYHQLMQTIMKYAERGIDRTTPKTVNINQTILTLDSIHEQIRNIKNITPVENEPNKD